MNFWEWIGRLDNILVLTVIFSGYAAYRLWRQNQRYQALVQEMQQSADIRQRIQDYKGVQTIKPVALAVSLLPTLPSIKDNVNAYLKSSKLKMPVKELGLPGIHGSA